MLNNQLYSLSLVIPAYNDEVTIERLVTDANEVLKDCCVDYEIIVCNDGSRDNTAAILEKLASENSRLKIIHHVVNQGFGRTIRELYFAGKKELIFSLPGDYQYSPREVHTMATGLSKGDLIIGLRVNRRDPVRRKIQSIIYNAMLRIFYGSNLQDVNSIKLFKRVVLENIQLLAKTAFVDAELCLRAQRAGFKVLEIPINHLPRQAQGASGGKISVISETFRELVTMRFSLK
ncbi:MAG: glycosyltransferase family 2 protein [Candidatus Obscuribacterales bacterium]|nr:glycosyltransferase family 2 protein [Candidatus Obscuribacterales bacterium]